MCLTRSCLSVTLLACPRVPFDTEISSRESYIRLLLVAIKIIYYLLYFSKQTLSSIYTFRTYSFNKLMKKIWFIEIRKVLKLFSFLIKS